MDVELLLFLLLILCSFIGYFCIYKYNNNLILIITNILFIAYGTTMAIIK